MTLASALSGRHKHNQKVSVAVAFIIQGHWIPLYLQFLHFQQNKPMQISECLYTLVLA